MPLRTNEELIQRVVSLAEIRAQARDTRRFDRTEIAAKIKERVIGQDVLADEIAHEIYRKAARKQKNKTLINFIISGPTGTGKTELAKAVAHAVFGEDHLLEVDCGTMGTREDALRALVGAPRVFQGASRGKIIEFLTRTKGDGVILFDEYEKAAPDENAPLAKILLRLLDEGRIQSQFDMEFVDATGCIVILSSNLKQAEFAAAAKANPIVRQLDEQCRRLLIGAMSPEFLGRFSLVVAPSPLTVAHRIRLATMMIDKLAAAHDIEILHTELDFDDLIMLCAEQCEALGVRQANGWLERQVEDEFIEAANERRLRQVKADWDGERLILSPAD